MLFAFRSLQPSDNLTQLRKTLSRLIVVALLVCPTVIQAADNFESRTWTDRKGNQLTSTFVDAKNGEVQLKNDEGAIIKFKLADFSEPDQKYLRDLANYRRKLAAGEKPTLPADPAQASLAIQPLQTNTEPVPDMLPYRKPLLDFPLRTWTDSTGRKIQGKLVTAYNDKVVLDVKGNVFDLSVTKLSPDDQQYISIQLKGLQREDLVTVLAKAASAGQQQPGSAPAPAAVATNNNPAPTTLANDDIKARLEQLKAQRGGSNPDAGNQVAANTPAAQPLGTDDIKARLAKIREQKGEPEPAQIPTQPTVAAQPTGVSHSELMAKLDREQQEGNIESYKKSYAYELSNPEEAKKAKKEKQDQIDAQLKQSRQIPASAISSDENSSSDSGSGGFRIRRINIGFFIAIGAAIVGGIARLFGRS
jgi:hypothetical protein